jgi:hypothetical protein
MVLEKITPPNATVLAVMIFRGKIQAAAAVAMVLI